MNQVKVQELINLKQQFIAGGAQEILYRQILQLPFLFEKYLEGGGKDLDKLRQSCEEWIDLCDKYNLDVKDSLIDIYTNGTIESHKISLYEDYTIIFEKMVDYLLGKVNWQPNASQNTVAVTHSHELTAQILAYNYSNL